MRILLTTDTIGGVWTFSTELCEQLLDRGNAVCLVSFGRAPTDGKWSWVRTTASRHADRFGFRAAEIPLEWMQDNEFAFSEGCGLLRQVASDFDADLLHSNQFCWGALPGRLPRLITAHSDVMSWAAACQPDVLDGSEWLSRYVRLVQTGLDGANLVVAPTSWMRDALRSSFRISSGFAVVYNGRSIPAHSAQGERTLQAISVGRLWDKAKGISCLLEVDACMPICLAGEEHFETASLASGASPLKSLGRLDEPALFDVFRRSAIYVAPSVYEPFGLAPLEAALCGCAIVAREIPSFREVWGDAAVYFRTATELEQALQSLGQSPSDLASTQLACGVRAETFTGERMAEEYLEFYKDLVNAADSPVHSPTEELAAHAA